MTPPPRTLRQRLGLRPGNHALRTLAYRWRLRLGDLGVAALAVALAALGLAALGWPALEGERAAVERLSRVAREAPASAPIDVPRPPRHPLLDRLPGVEQRNADIATLMQLSRRHELIGARTQYRLHDPTAAPIERVEVSLGATQTYEHWRAFMVAVLNELPNAAVTTAAWTRAHVDAERIEGRLVIVLHHRRGP